LSSACAHITAKPISSATPITLNLRRHYQPQPRTTTQATFHPHYPLLLHSQPSSSSFHLHKNQRKPKPIPHGHQQLSPPPRNTSVHTHHHLPPAGGCQTKPEPKRRIPETNQNHIHSSSSLSHTQIHHNNPIQIRKKKNKRRETLAGGNSEREWSLAVSRTREWGRVMVANPDTVVGTAVTSCRVRAHLSLVRKRIGGEWSVAWREEAFFLIRVS